MAIKLETSTTKPSYENSTPSPKHLPVEVDKTSQTGQGILAANACKPDTEAVVDIFLGNGFQPTPIAPKSHSKEQVLLHKALNEPELPRDVLPMRDWNMFWM